MPLPRQSQQATMQIVAVPLLCFADRHRLFDHLCEADRHSKGPQVQPLPETLTTLKQVCRSNSASRAHAMTQQRIHIN